MGWLTCTKQLFPLSNAGQRSTFKVLPTEMRNELTASKGREDTATFDDGSQCDRLVSA